MSPAFPPKSIAVVLGTRPEVVKLAHVIRLLGDAAVVIHSGQHYDNSLSKVFFEAFQLEDPEITLDVGGTSRGAQIGQATGQLDAVFSDRPLRAVIVQGDTNTALAGGLAANAREIPLCHVESGLRSYDRRMPEEHNRVLVDHLADLCCAPTEINVINLASEGIAGDRVTRTGNTVVEAVQELLPGADDRADILNQLGLARDGFILATLHRPENVDDPDRLEAILTDLKGLPLPVVLPLHPRTRQTAQKHDISFGTISVMEPLDYVTFLGLGAEAAALVSDSGGVQEEASIIKRPVAVVRRSTERPEVQGTFATMVDGSVADAVTPWLDDPASTHEHLSQLPSPYGDGAASRLSLEALSGLVG